LKEGLGLIDPIYKETTNLKKYEESKPDLKYYEEIGYGSTKHYR
jgi:hypothetical protein